MTMTRRTVQKRKNKRNIQALHRGRKKTKGQQESRKGDKTLWGNQNDFARRRGNVKEGKGLGKTGKKGMEVETTLELGYFTKPNNGEGKVP